MVTVSNTSTNSLNPCPSPSHWQIERHLLGDTHRLALAVGPLLIGQPIGSVSLVTCPDNART